MRDKLFKYARYNVKLENDEIKQYGFSKVPAHKLAKLDAVDYVETLLELVKAYATRT